MRALSDIPCVKLSSSSLLILFVVVSPGGVLVVVRAGGTDHDHLTHSANPASLDGDSAEVAWLCGVDMALRR
jgi:hypothetical protein